ncbi:acetoacetate decarboxylase family protein [Limnobacter parvus]|uniref:Acetoacetate decarboxylase family protein n=1 Tax=Limnobacter parvus TaxID=2939690 RepID=A0ABT1XK14_9BURK|nr:acetoacetate decarboxylase family protein [Limnobacter parvus]MCR2747620.1 acetoacetate decarboxylase family protein [Limnobacter parvus]
MNTQLNSIDLNDDEFVGIEEVPAPWTLNGKGLIVVLRSKADKLLADQRIPLDIRDTLKTPVSVLMYVDYTHSNAGPYKELLYIPGTAQFSNKLGNKRLLTISNIVVSSASSVKNGRINWGIPKNLCSFDLALGPNNTQVVSLHHEGVPQFELAYRGKGFTFPINTGLVPGFMKTLGQRWGGKEFMYSPSAKGKARFANVHVLQNLGNAFPDLEIADVLTALEITQFQMTFPLAEIA